MNNEQNDIINERLKLIKDFVGRDDFTVVHYKKDGSIRTQNVRLRVTRSVKSPTILNVFNVDLRQYRKVDLMRIVSITCHGELLSFGDNNG